MCRDIKRFTRKMLGDLQEYTQREQHSFTLKSTRYLEFTYEQINSFSAQLLGEICLPTASVFVDDFNLKIQRE